MPGQLIFVAQLVPESFYIGIQLPSQMFCMWSSCDFYSCIKVKSRSPTYCEVHMCFCFSIPYLYSCITTVFYFQSMALHSLFRVKQEYMECKWYICILWNMKLWNNSGECLLSLPLAWVKAVAWNTWQHLRIVTY